MEPLVDYQLYYKAPNKQEHQRLNEVLDEIIIAIEDIQTRLNKLESNDNETVRE